MNESSRGVDSSPDVPDGIAPEPSRLEQWNWIARARGAAARSLDLISPDGPGLPGSGRGPRETSFKG